MPIAAAYTLPSYLDDDRPYRQATGSFLDGTVRAGGRFATDGSGGTHTKDPRLRRCSWSVVHYEWRGDPVDGGEGIVVLGTLAGPLAGPNQSSARAELQAIVALLQCTDADVHVWCDCSAVVKRCHKGPSSANRSRMAGLWHDFWTLLEGRQLEQEGGTFSVTWCPSHKSEEEVLMGYICAEAHAANHAADRLAEETAADFQVSVAIVKEVKERDEEINLVQDRLMAINQELINTRKVAAPAVEQKAAAVWARRRRLLLASRQETTTQLVAPRPAGGRRVSELLGENFPVVGAAGPKQAPRGRGKKTSR